MPNKEGGGGDNDDDDNDSQSGGKLAVGTLGIFISFALFVCFLGVDTEQQSLPTTHRLTGRPARIRRLLLFDF